MVNPLTVMVLLGALLLSQGGPPAPLPPPPINGSHGADALTAGLHGYLDSLASRREFAGVALVARDGRVLFERAYGLADIERGIPLEPSTRFNIASIGKAFTKVAIGQLVARGRLALADTIGARLPAYPNPDARGATIEQLLGHTAGVVDFFGPRFDAAPKDRFASNADYFRFVAPQPLNFPPGSRRQYCNGCYIVLGEIVAAVSGIPYEQYIADHVFAPAGMKGAGFASYGDPGVAIGYTGRGGGPLRPTTGMHGRRGSAAGGAFARAADLLAFDNALRERRLLDAKMTAWFLEDAPVEAGRSRGAYGIAGGAPGTNCSVEADGTWTVIVMGNLDPPNAGRVARAIYQAVR
jgi:CubicO group peptidase (beta-lactamase class C family)